MRREQTRHIFSGLAQPTESTGDGGRRITDPAQVAEAIRVEYKALREQIAEADRTCVVLQGALLTATLALVSLGSERDAPGLAWLIGPLWMIGHCYLAEKRAIIVHTARYLLTEIEPRHAGLQWETWHHRQLAKGVPQPVRFYPLYLETVIGATIVLGDVFFVAVLQDGLFDAPWFAFACIVAVAFAALVTRSLLKYKRFEDYLARL